MLPHLHDVSIAHDTDEVSPLNGAQPMGDDEHSATPCGPVQSFLHYSLWFCIQGTGGFIQYQDAGVLNQGAGDRNTLFLTTW